MTRATYEQRDDQRAREMQRTFDRKDLEGQMHRYWDIGDVYAPHDLSSVEISKWKRPRKVKSRWDVVDQLGINPIHHYKVSRHLSRADQC